MVKPLKYRGLIVEDYDPGTLCFGYENECACEFRNAYCAHYRPDRIRHTVQSVTHEKARAQE